MKPCVEEWKSVVGFETRYKVSNWGNVRSLDWKDPRIWRKHQGRLLRPWLNHCSPRVALGAGERRNVDALVAEAFMGKCPDGYSLRHKNGDKSDNRLENLDYFSPLESAISAIRKKADGCVLWDGHMSREGYGRLGTEYAHRTVYTRLVGPIADGLQIDHLCRNRACVNPSHLQAVTQRVNILRGSGAAARNARKEFCIRGHEFDGIRRMGNGTGRTCSKCAKIREARRGAKRALLRESPPTGQSQ